MGYYANGYGDATLKKNVNIEEIDKKLSSIVKNFCNFEYEIDDTNINFWDDNKYHEEDTLEFLEALIPYITEGIMDYHGEGGDLWRFQFNPKKKKWIEKCPQVVYDDEEMIEILKKKGYEIKKKKS